MSDPHLNAVLLAPTPGINTDAPEIPPAVDPKLAARAVSPPLVEPLETFLPRLERVARILGPAVSREVSRAPLPRRVSHRQFQTTLDVGQGSRGSCWAFAGVAALEAAYARINVHVDLSEQYLFHISKAHENHRNGGGINSLIGFQGSSDIVHHLSYWAVPLSSNVPYIDQPQLQALANSIPGTGGGLASAAGGTREQDDWFEFDLRNIPLMGRWFAQYRVERLRQDNQLQQQRHPHHASGRLRRGGRRVRQDQQRRPRPADPRLRRRRARPSTSRTRKPCPASRR